MTDILDVSAFPIVTMAIADRSAHGSPAWQDEMDRLIERDQAFILITQGDRPKEEPSEAMARMNWYKSRDDRLSAICRAMIYVEPDDAKRTMLEAQSKAIRSTFKLRFDLVASHKEALALGHELLGQ